MNHFLLRLTNGPHWESFVAADLSVGEQTEWGIVGGTFRSAGDIKLFREGGIAAGDLLLVRERFNPNRVVFPALVRIVSIAQRGDTWTPTYEVVERFDTDLTLKQIRSEHAWIDELPYFTKNAPGGYMLRSFVPLERSEQSRLIDVLRSTPALPSSRPSASPSAGSGRTA